MALGACQPAATFFQPAALRAVAAALASNGTGALALALAAQWPEALVTAVDRSADALALAGENTEKLGFSGRVKLVRSDWFSELAGGGPYELIVANPPYLSAEETAEAEIEVRVHEPAGALTAADSGLADLRTIIAGARDFLASGGLLALETGIDQHAALAELLAGTGYVAVESVRDLTDRDRFMFARKA